jgi:hypothetical protein
MATLSGRSNLPVGPFKGAQVWDFDLLDFNDFFIMKSL